MLASNAHNFVRATSLRPFSLEMVALVVGLFLAYRYRRGGLIALYALSLPFTDLVYRIGPVLISDVIGLALLARYGFRGRPWLVGPLLVWLALGVLANLVGVSSLFSIAYTVRFAAMLLIAATVPLTRGQAGTAVRAMRAVTILAAAISVLQVVLWRLGLPIDGVFAALGFVRPKGLAHEPSTSAAWFAMALPLAVVRRRGVSDAEASRIDWPLLAAIGVGLGLTASLSGVLITAAIAAIWAVGLLRRLSSRALWTLAASTVFVVWAGLATFRGQVDYLFDKVALYVEEYTGSGAVAGSVGSGREGDLVLLTATEPGIIRGDGVFTAPETGGRLLQERGTYVPAANILVTTLVETGAIGLLLFLVALALVGVGVIRDLGGRRPEYVAGFFGFCGVLLGQRLLAFPQPWFMLATARGLDAGHTPGAMPSPPSLSNIDSGPIVKESIDVDRTDVGKAIRQYWKSTLVILVVGMIAVLASVLSFSISKTAVVEIGSTGRASEIAALDLPGGLAPEFDPIAEAARISTTYSLSAVPAGTVVRVSANGSSLDEASRALDSFVDDYLLRANTGWPTALEQAKVLGDETVQSLSTQIAALDEQIVATSEPATVIPLSLERAELATELARAQLVAFSYEQLSPDDGPIGVLSGPAESAPARTRQLLVAVGATFLVVCIAVGQAWWRAARRTRP